MDERELQAARVVGWAEQVDIPAWNIRGLKAKVDTGARSSALHVENLQELPHGRVRFDVRLHRKKPDRRVTVESRVVRRARVRASSGQTENRIFVRTRIEIGPYSEEIELSLVSREKMIFRMLLGRSALRRPLLVDASRSYLLSRAKKAKSIAPPRRPEGR
ncbi:MAG: RimK/LysX family protein [Candidatus Eisenbacteria bacterium]